MTTPVRSSSFTVSCLKCGANYDGVFQPFCAKCDGITDVAYDTEAVRLRDSGNPYERFLDLLPVRDASLLPDDVTYTPMVHAKALGQRLGLPHLYLKDETRNATGTTKDRMAAIAMAYLYECGVRSFASSSTGNSSTGFCFALPRFPGMRLYIFTAENWRNRVQFADHPDIIHYVMRGATFTEASDYSATFGKLNGLVSERGFFNLARREGLKLAYFEATDQIDGPIHWYVQAVSSAMGSLGTFKGAKELQAIGHIDTLPRLLCVQQETCAPAVRAWEDGSDSIRPEHVVAQPHGIAEAILRGDPRRSYPWVYQAVRESRGNLLAVSEAEIREARRMLLELEGIDCCFSASTAVAGLIKELARGGIPREDNIMVNLTGSDREVDVPAEQASNVRWLSRTEKGWVADKPELEQGLVHSGDG